MNSAPRTEPAVWYCRYPHHCECKLIAKRSPVRYKSGNGYYFKTPRVMCTFPDNCNQRTQQPVKAEYVRFDL